MARRQFRPEHKDHVWSYDFMADRTSDGRPFRILTIIDEYTRECPAIAVDRRITSQDVIGKLFQLFVSRGVPEHIRSGQWGRIHCQGTACLVAPSGGEDSIH